MSLPKLLHDRLPPEKLSLLPIGFEVIGDIAIITIPKELEDEKYLIAEALKQHRNNLRTVLQKTSKIKGNVRVADFEILLGERTTTFHRENECIFNLDVTKTFFSGKMYYERGRIVQKVMNGEDVLVMFAGVGPFLIPVRKKKSVNITGLDNNMEACRYLKRNLILNHIEANIINGDAKDIVNLFKKGFNRIVMPAPYGQDIFLDLAEHILMPGGCVHFYTFKKDFEIPHFRKLLEEKGWHIDFSRACGNVAPRVKRYVFDLIRKS